MYAFVLQVSHERYLTISQLNTSRKGKRKDQSENEKTTILSDREKLALVIDLMRHLKNGLQIAFNNIGNLLLNIYYNCYLITPILLQAI